MTIEATRDGYLTGVCSHTGRTSTQYDGGGHDSCCEVCGEWFADAAGTQPIADQTSVVLPKLTPGQADDDGSTAPADRISIWEWFLRLIRKLISLLDGPAVNC